MVYYCFNHILSNIVVVNIPASSCRIIPALHPMNHASGFFLRFVSYGDFHSHGGTLKWMVDKGKAYEHRWFRDSPIYGNLHSHFLWWLVDNTDYLQYPGRHPNGHNHQADGLATIRLLWLNWLTEELKVWNPPGRCWETSHAVKASHISEVVGRVDLHSGISQFDSGKLKSMKYPIRIHDQWFTMGFSIHLFVFVSTESMMIQWVVAKSCSSWRRGFQPSLSTGAGFRNQHHPHVVPGVLHVFPMFSPWFVAENPPCPSLP